MTQPLSPAAQEVLDAPTRAAALRALADQVVPEEAALQGGVRPGGTGALTPDEIQHYQRTATRRKILAIAAELGPDGSAVPDGREPPTPLSPSDRMPGTKPGDLDDVGRCWLWSASADSLDLPAQWRLLRPMQSAYWDRWLPASVKHLPTEVE